MVLLQKFSWRIRITRPCCHVKLETLVSGIASILSAAASQIPSKPGCCRRLGGADGFKQIWYTASTRLLLPKHHCHRLFFSSPFLSLKTLFYRWGFRSKFYSIMAMHDSSFWGLDECGYVLGRFMGEGQGLESGFVASTRKSTCFRSSVGIFFYQLGETIRGWNGG